MKKIYGFHICILAIIFLTAGVSMHTDDTNTTIQQLVCKRVEILTSFYDGDCSSNRTRERLANVESGSLLKEDVAAMKRNAATDFDRVRNCKVKITSCKKTSYGIWQGKISVNWIMENQREIYETSGEYYFTGEKNKKRIKLTQFEKI